MIENIVVVGGGGDSDDGVDYIDSDGHQNLDCVKSHALVIGFSGRWGSYLMTSPFITLNDSVYFSPFFRNHMSIC